MVFTNGVAFCKEAIHNAQIAANNILRMRCTAIPQECGHFTIDSGVHFALGFYEALFWLLNPYMKEFDV